MFSQFMPVLVTLMLFKVIASQTAKTENCEFSKFLICQVKINFFMTVNC